MRAGSTVRNSPVDPVIAYDIVKDDVAQRGAYEIGDAIAKDSEKAPAEAPKSRPVKKHHTSVKAQKNADPLVVDLHIGELIDDYAGLSNADILNYQIDRFRETMDENMRFGGKKIIAPSPSERTELQIQKL